MKKFHLSTPYSFIMRIACAYTCAFVILIYTASEFGAILATSTRSGGSNDRMATRKTHAGKSTHSYALRSREVLFKKPMHSKGKTPKKTRQKVEKFSSGSHAIKGPNNVKYKIFITKKSGKNYLLHPFSQLFGSLEILANFFPVFNFLSLIFLSM